MRFRPLFTAAPLLLLAACGANPQAAPGPTVAAPAEAAAGEAAELAALPAPARPVMEPSRLRGLSPPQVRAVLGPPVFTRRDAPAEIWQYRGRDCTLDLFLYDETAGQSVAHYAVRSANAMGEAECFNQLTTARRGVPAS